MKKKILVFLGLLALIFSMGAGSSRRTYIVEFKSPSISEGGDREVIEDEQTAFLEVLAGKDRFFKLSYRYSYLLNGLAFESSQDSILDWQGDGFKIREAGSAFMDMTYSNRSIGLDRAYESFPYRGEGMVLALIDSGLDYRHKDMVLNSSKMKLDRRKVEKLTKDYGLKGGFFTDKVPYGVNYIDENPRDIKDGNIWSKTYMHGMHIAGIIGANGELKGLAPEAQILSMKVFSNRQGVPSSEADLIKALEDSVILGADVINLSLGYENMRRDGFYRAIENAVDMGLVVVGSAGNKSFSSYPNKYRGIYDTSTISKLPKDVIQVASVDNSRETYPSLIFQFEGRERRLPYSYYGDSLKLKGDYNIISDLEDLENPQRTILVLDSEEDYRGEMTLAKEKNLAGFLFLTDDFYKDWNLDGDYFYGQLKREDFKRIGSLESKVFNFSEEIFEGYSSYKKLSYFSSWGPGEDLNLKPDLSAIGGNVYSTINGNSYKSMSGTSMAVGQVSSMSLILKEQIRRENLKSKNFEEADLIKGILMNTASPQYSLGVPYSPRKQGAGLINAYRALRTEAIVYGDSGFNISLGEISDEEEFSIYMENLGQEVLEFKIDKPKVYREIGASRNQEPYNVVLEDSSLELKEDTIVLGPGETRELKARLRLGPSVLEDNFIEGFIFFKSQGDYPSLSLAYMGFYGDYEGQKKLDNPRETLTSYTGKTRLKAVRNIDGRLELEDFKGKVSINPESEDGYSQLVQSLNAFRDLEDFSFKLVDTRRQTLRNIARIKFIGKTYGMDAPDGEVYDVCRWDGKLMKDDSLVEADEGEYYINYSFKSQDGRNSYLLPVYVDKTAPSLNLDDYIFSSGENLLLKVEAEDNLTGVLAFEIIVDDGKVQALDGTYFHYPNKSGDLYELRFKLPKGGGPVYRARLVAYDHSLNKTSKDFTIVDRSESKLNMIASTTRPLVGSTMELTYDYDGDFHSFGIIIGDREYRTSEKYFLLPVPDKAGSLVLKVYDEKGKVLDLNGLDLNPRQK